MELIYLYLMEKFIDGRWTKADARKIGTCDVLHIYYNVGLIILEVEDGLTEEYISSCCGNQF
jgi:hypothetical protein